MKKIQRVKSENEAKSWADAIEYAEAKITELKDAIRIFRAAIKTESPWPGKWPNKPATRN